MSNDLKKEIERGIQLLELLTTARLSSLNVILVS